jgi:hypothetical protein
MKGSDDMITRKTSRPDLLTAAILWGAEQAHSKAQTLRGKIKAAHDYVKSLRGTAEHRIPIFGADNTIFDPLLDTPDMPETLDQTLIRLYLDAQQEEAMREMQEAFARRERWTGLKKLVAKVPLYARFVVYGEKVPESVRRAWKGRSGQLLTSGGYIDRIAEVAFARAPWGRLQKRYKGKSCLAADIRTETNGKYGWNKVSWHYADFTAIQSPDKRRIWVRYPDGSETEYHATLAGTMKIEGVRLMLETRSEPVIRAHHLRRYYTAPLRRLAGITWVWDRTEQAGYYLSADGERYHTEARPMGQAQSYYRLAITAFRKRRAEKAQTAKRKAAEQRLTEHADRIFVQMEDSVTAGNCPIGTRAFAAPLLAELADGYPAAVRADVILARRDDSFTRRACLQAAMRTV